MEKEQKIQEYIRKYQISLLVRDEQDMMRLDAPPKAAKIVAEVKAAKPEIIAELKRQKAERENQKAAEKAAHEAAKQEMRDGKYPIQLQWYDGEILSGYMPADEAVRELLEELGLGKYVEGWGTYRCAHSRDSRRAGVFLRRRQSHT